MRNRNKSREKSKGKSDPCEFPKAELTGRVEVAGYYLTKTEVRRKCF